MDHNELIEKKFSLRNSKVVVRHDEKGKYEEEEERPKKIVVKHSKALIALFSSLGIWILEWIKFREIGVGSSRVTLFSLFWKLK